MQSIDTVNLYSHTGVTATNTQLMSNAAPASGISWRCPHVYGSKEPLKAQGMSDQGLLPFKIQPLARMKS